ncbi:PTS mannose/fructose/sorbose/N-acetylgalactosamine transporter subunit IIC [Enterococcus avium]
MLIQCILLAVWAGICILDERIFQFGTPMALIAGSVAGVIMGDVSTGLIISGTLQMMWMANAGVGAYVPPNQATGAIVGVAVAIMAGGGVATGVAIAVPTAMLCQQIVMLTNTLNIYWMHKADAAVETGDFDKVARYNYLGLPFSFLAGFIPVFIASYLGGPAIKSVINSLPTQLFDGLTVAAGIIPVVGLGMLLMMMLNKNLWIFLVLGFVLSSYLKLGTIAICLLGIVFAVLYDLIIRKNENIQVTASVQGYANEDVNEEEDYDL